MAADRTVPCDHLIRRESSWKAESVIGWSAAQHELGGSGCPNRNQMAKFHEKKKKIQGRKGAHRGETLLYLLHSSQASWQSEDTKKSGKMRMFPLISL